MHGTPIQCQSKTEFVRQFLLYILEWHWYIMHLCLICSFIAEWKLITMWLNRVNFFTPFFLAGKLLSTLLCCKLLCCQTTWMVGILMCGRSKFTALDRACPCIFLHQLLIANKLTNHHVLLIVNKLPFVIAGTLYRINHFTLLQGSSLPTLLWDEKSMQLIARSY